MSIGDFEPLKESGDLYYVEGTNKFSRFFIKHFHRPEHEIQVPKSLISTGTSVDSRNVTSPNAASSIDGNSTKETASANPGATDEIAVPASLVGTGTSVDGRNVTSPNTAPSTGGNNTKETASADSEATNEFVQVRRHRRSSKNKKLFEELAKRAISIGADIDLSKTAEKLGLDSSRRPVQSWIKIYKLTFSEESTTSKKLTISTLRKFIKETFLSETDTNETEKNIINFVHDLQRRGIDENISPEDINTFFKIYPTDNQEIKKVKEFLLKITSSVKFENEIISPSALSKSRSFLEEFQIELKGLVCGDIDFVQKRLYSQNPIGNHIYNKVYFFDSLLPPEELAKNFESSINDIATQLEIDLSECNNLLKKMNALIEAANDSSEKLNKPFLGWTGNISSPKDQTLKDAISELLLFFTYAKEIAKFDAAWNDNIIAWNAELETLNDDNNNSPLE